MVHVIVSMSGWADALNDILMLNIHRLPDMSGQSEDFMIILLTCIYMYSCVYPSIYLHVYL